jgi:hypothetical protein
VKITNLSIKGGQSLSLGKLTVLVGPNNSGKSRTLKDIVEWIVNDPAFPPTLVQDVGIEWPKVFADEACDPASRIASLAPVGARVSPYPAAPGAFQFHGLRAGRNQQHLPLYPGNLFQRYPTPDGQSVEQWRTAAGSRGVIQSIGPYWVTVLDGDTRLTVANRTQSPNMHSQPVPANPMQALRFDETDVGERLRSAFEQAFSMDIVQDDSGLQELMFRVSRDFSDLSEVDRKKYQVMGAFPVLDDQGDGYKSFAGVVLSITLCRDKIVLLDEPEAFLHQLQARILGQWIGTYAQEFGGQIIIATHNASFLSGILAASRDVTIYRLNRAANDTTYTRISQGATAQLATSPLLSNQRILDAIFADGVVVSEGDPDHHVYQSVANGILGCRDLLFIQSYNKQVIYRIVELLKNCAIPVCAIADIDVLNSASEFKRVLDSFSSTGDISGMIQRRHEIALCVDRRDEEMILNEIRNDIEQLLSQLDDNRHTVAGIRSALGRIRGQASRWDQVKKKGIKGIPANQRTNASLLIKEAAKIGLFILPVGELEGWMTLGTSQKQDWIVEALSRLHDGACPLRLELFMRAVIRFMHHGTPLPRNRAPVS